MREAKRIKLRHAYFGPLTLREIARANAVGEKMLERFWRDEKAAGRLANAPRPFFAKFCQPDPAPAAEVALDAGDDALGFDADETPIGQHNRVCKTECDALLAAMRKHHVDRPAAHCVPEAWLRFDLKGMPTPPHAMLMTMCRMRDAVASLAGLARVPSRGVPA
jgi:hypothetical protein